MPSIRPFYIYILPKLLLLLWKRGVGKWTEGWTEGGRGGRVCPPSDTAHSPCQAPPHHAMLSMRGGTSGLIPRGSGALPASRCVLSPQGDWGETDGHNQHHHPRRPLLPDAKRAEGRTDGPRPRCEEDGVSMDWQGQHCHWPLVRRSRGWHLSSVRTW